MKTYENIFINGSWVKPQESNEYIDVINPANEEIIAKVVLGSKKDVDIAAKAAEVEEAAPVPSQQPLLPFIQKLRILLFILLFTIKLSCTLYMNSLFSLKMVSKYFFKRGSVALIFLSCGV